MLSSSNFKMTYRFATVRNIAITTLKFVNKVRANISGNGVLELKKASQSIFGLKHNFYIALW